VASQPARRTAVLIDNSVNGRVLIDAIAIVTIRAIHLECG
jgi:hypothetical protein